MTLDAHSMMWLLAGGVGVTFLLFVAAFQDDVGGDIKRRLSRVGPQGRMRSSKTEDRQHAVRRTGDSTIPLLNIVVRMLPNPNKLRHRIARTGKNLMLGEYLLINLVIVSATFFVSSFFDVSRLVVAPVSIILGFGVPHFIIGIMGSRRLKKFLAAFPEAIDTMCRGLRSGLPVTESIVSVGREMPDPVGIEFQRIADGVRLGRSLEAAMWEVSERIDTADFRFLIIAMAIQKETGGNLAETLGNLSDLIRRRRQLRLKIKAMSSEAFASAMIIGSLPFIMFTLLMLVNPEYMSTMFHTPKGKFLLSLALFWMGIGWAVMAKMIRFEI